MEVALPDVLIVDDDEDIRVSLRYVLEDIGYRVYEAPDGQPALRRLHESPSRMVVLLDLQMPGMDGKQLLQAAAQHDTLATRHAYILMTANAKTLPLGFATLLTELRVPVLTKPFDLEALLDLVQVTAQRLRA